MKKWILTASIDAVNIDFETVIESDVEPGYWECNDLAASHGCPYWTISELEE